MENILKSRWSLVSWGTLWPTGCRARSGSNWEESVGTQASTLSTQWSTAPTWSGTSRPSLRRLMLAGPSLTRTLKSWPLLVQTSLLALSAGVSHPTCLVRREKARATGTSSYTFTPTSRDTSAATTASASTPSWGATTSNTVWTTATRSTASWWTSAPATALCDLPSQGWGSHRRTTRRASLRSRRTSPSSTSWTLTTPSHFSNYSSLWSCSGPTSTSNIATFIKTLMIISSGKVSRM